MPGSSPVVTSGSVPESSGEFRLSSGDDLVIKPSRDINPNASMVMMNFCCPLDWKLHFSHCLSVVELRPSSSLSTGCVVPLRRD